MAATTSDLEVLGRVSLDEVTQKCLELTHLSLIELERRGKALHSMRPRAFQEHTGNLAKLQRGLVGILKEARALAKEEHDSAENMSHSDMVKYLVSAIGRLPLDYQHEIRDQLTGIPSC